MFKNPVFAQDFADPFILKVGKTYYGYATQPPSAVVDINTATSKDLVHWKPGKDAMPLPPPWAIAGNYWAPSVFRRPDGKYDLWFAAADQNAGVQCVGYAVSAYPAGPFTAKARKPSICQAKLGGSIDPFVFRDNNGKVYVLWKNDGESVGARDWLWSQRANSDATALIGKPVKLDYNRRGWEGSTVENPALWRQGHAYFLFFSGGDWSSYGYSVAYAQCKGPLGPCSDRAAHPILTSRCSAAGPGGETIIRDAKGQDWIAYHAWPATHEGDQSYGRQLWIDRLDWPHGHPVVHGPTCARQPAPAT
jgi:beta-xylosidase